ncbi:MAG TPA: DUF1800 domain-containing protein [Candidatus Methylacidiphilales bacterium]|nr:DUF1800 domain-containing protein [Candidatus Methylacidiphilales bacterium]
MSVSRRTFLRVGGATLAALTATSCDQLQRTAAPGSRDFSQGSNAKAEFPLLPTESVPSPLVYLINRISFGMRPGDYTRISALGKTQELAAARYLEEQLKPESIDDSELHAQVRRLEVLAEPLAEMYEYKENYLLAQLTQAAILRATFSRCQLQELMVQFWSDHFNIDTSKGECRWLKAADDRDVIRRHALGSFPDLLRASALSPAMLWYLDGRVNRKSRPEDKANENYARELMELHTLGLHGGYSQRDVMEVARCLTGWTVRDKNQLRKGIVEFHPEDHDDGAKSVLGHEIPAGLGRGDLDRVLEIVTLHSSTAQHLATKLCRRFIADSPPSEAIKSVAATFLSTRGDIRATLRTLFQSPEFMAARGVKMRRPFEFIVAALRATNAACKRPEALMRYLVSMGHAPYQYPTPEGYSMESAPWMGTLLWRWNFAVALSANRVEGVEVDIPALRELYKGNDDALMTAVLGRTPEPAERDAYHDSGDGLALLLASPSFQYC